MKSVLAHRSSNIDTGLSNIRSLKPRSISFGKRLSHTVAGRTIEEDTLITPPVRSRSHSQVTFTSLSTSANMGPPIIQLRKDSCQQIDTCKTPNMHVKDDTETTSPRRTSINSIKSDGAVSTSSSGSKKEKSSAIKKIAMKLQSDPANWQEDLRTDRFKQTNHSEVHTGVANKPLKGRSQQPNNSEVHTRVVNKPLRIILTVGTKKHNLHSSSQKTNSLDDEDSIAYTHRNNQYRRKKNSVGSRSTGSGSISSDGSGDWKHSTLEKMVKKLQSDPANWTESHGNKLQIPGTVWMDDSLLECSTLIEDDNMSRKARRSTIRSVSSSQTGLSLIRQSRQLVDNSSSTSLSSENSNTAKKTILHRQCNVALVDQQAKKKQPVATIKAEADVKLSSVARLFSRTAALIREDPSHWSDIESCSPEDEQQSTDKIERSKEQCKSEQVVRSSMNTTSHTVKRSSSKSYMLKTIKDDAWEEITFVESPNAVRARKTMSVMDSMGNSPTMPGSTFDKSSNRTPLIPSRPTSGNSHRASIVGGRRKSQQPHIRIVRNVTEVWGWDYHDYICGRLLGVGDNALEWYLFLYAV